MIDEPRDRRGHVIEAVTFDYWETLVSEGAGVDAEEDGSMRSRQLRRWSAILDEAGFPVDDVAIEQAFTHNWEAFHECWRANVQYGPREATPLMCRFLEIEPPPEVLLELVESFAEVGRDSPLQLAPGAEDCLRALRDSSVRIGIICDVGMTYSPTLRARLEDFGVLEFFDHWSFSDEVGCFKPYPAVFEHALVGLGVRDPSRAVHVGDGRRTDMAGALAMGMTAVRYTHFNDPPPETGPDGHFVLDDHARLPATLGLA
jgi:HAD superfamily hydrolase (TIGR01549 family)